LKDAIGKGIVGGRRYRTLIEDKSNYRYKVGSYALVPYKEGKLILGVSGS